jgi:hypothetical protein
LLEYVAEHRYRYVAAIIPLAEPGHLLGESIRQFQGIGDRIGGEQPLVIGPHVKPVVALIDGAEQRLEVFP